MELWDSSGSDQYEACWPAMQRDAHGVIFVFNPDSEAQAKHLDSFHQAFVQGEIVCYKAEKGIECDSICVYVTIHIYMRMI